MSTHDKKVYGTATVGTKGQVVIPAEAREALGIQPGDKLFVIGSEAKQFVGFIKEEQLRAVIDKLTEDTSQLKVFLTDTSKG